MRILLAEDEKRTAEHLKRGLMEEGYAVDLALDGEEALWLGENNPYDVIILDVMMPGRDGFSIVRHLRRRNIATPVALVAWGSCSHSVRRGN